MVNLYLSAIVAFLVLPEAVCEPLYLLGFITAEGDLIHRVAESGGPVWLVKALLGSLVLICSVILWRVLPEVWKSWKARFLRPTA